MIVDLYLELFENDPKVFSKEMTKAYNFAPLSSLMAGSLSSLSNKQVLSCLRILNSEDIQAYNDKFLEELHQRY
jgi:hypothetical protein